MSTAPGRSDSLSSRHFPLYVSTTLFVVLAAYTLQLAPWGHDVDHHLFKLGDLYGPFSRGSFFNTFSENLALGLGLPAYVFYSQWIYVFPALLVALGFTLHTALSISYLLLVCIAYGGCYRLGRLHSNQLVSHVGALLLVSCNYFLGDLFTRSAYSEFFAYCVLPWLLYFLHRALSSTKSMALVPASLSLAAMILAHPLSFINATPLVAVYGLCIAARHNSWPGSVLRGLLVAILGLGLTAFFWLPGLVEKEYVLGVLGLNIHFARTFLSVEQMFMNWAYWLNMGITLNLVLLISIVILITRSRQLSNNGCLALGLLACIGLYTLLCFPVSNFVWEASSILQANQFVSRLMLPLSIAVVLLFTISFGQHIALGKHTITLYALIVCTLVQAILFVHFHTHALFRASGYPKWFYDDSATAHIQQQIGRYKTEIHGWGRSEFKPKPKDSNTLVAQPPCHTNVLRADMKTGRNSWTFDYQLDASECVLYLSRFWHPRLKAYEHRIGNLEVYINENGGVTLKPEAISGQITLVVSQPSYVKSAKKVSRFSLLLIMLIVIFGIAQRQARVSQPGS